MQEGNPKLTLDRPVTYEIKVPGHLDERWTEWDGEMSVTIENAEDGQPITVLKGIVDQAALQGLLRRLYALGLPLISVSCVKCIEKNADSQPPAAMS
ncbi:MAG: hypothetical protein M9928_09300 [Anaerolineae bacterium]|nr:hypothetical protein [Anaerolineae bacterium]MCO5198215.1 hypothetical protein [Anaerolineae bacterium]MCO5205216.1 hypothetical protein [Anaerolineae bacterium]